MSVPIIMITKMWFVFVLTFIQTVNSGGPILKQIHAVIRHGERSPTETYKNDPHVNYNWPNGWGQLTNRGKYEMFALGQKLGEVYQNFKPKYYFPSNIRIASSYAERCQATGQLLLAGFYPPKDKQIWNADLAWQPIPIISLARAEDTLLAQKVKCKRWEEEFKSVLASEEIRKIDEEHSDLYSYLSKHTGEEIDGIPAVESLYNTLEIEMLNNLTLPSWTKSVFNNDMKYLASTTLAIYTNNDYMKKIKGGYLLRQILNSMKRKQENSTEPIMYFYIAHDISIVSLLRTMGLKDILKPGFGSSFIIELYQNNSQYEIKMLYRDDTTAAPEELKLNGSSSPCTLEEFERILTPVIPGDYNEECQNDINIHVVDSI